jgi:hypothetical protein
MRFGLTVPQSYDVEDAMRRGYCDAALLREGMMGVYSESAA